jgi:isoquinoline 1-oxidoreductase beta subunit
VQCGYCQPGQTLAAIALLEANPSPDEPTVDRWMNGNLCRCGTYPRIRRAIHDAASTLTSGDQPNPLTATPEPERPPLTQAEADDLVHPYIRIRPDGTVVVFSSQIEMGQGIHTGLATIIAEELDADFDAIRVVNAANGRRGERDVYGNPELGGLFQITGASNSTKGYWRSYRIVAAKARARLVAAAAAQWNVPPDQVTVDAGIVRHHCGVQATFSELAAAAEQIPVPDGVQPKPKTAYNSDEPPTGVGEVSVPTTAPAVGNAIAALTGTRVRRLPINKSIRIY